MSMVQQDQFPVQTFGRFAVLIAVGGAAIVFLFWGAFQLLVPSSAPNDSDTCVSLDLANPPAPCAGGYRSCDSVNPLTTGDLDRVESRITIKVAPMPTMVYTPPPTPVVTVPPLEGPFG